MSVDGPVAGAAANMVVAADFCIATEKSRFIQAFVGVVWRQMLAVFTY